MSELAETPSVTRGWCPGCDPDADETRDLLAVDWCIEHRPSVEGLDDARVSSGRYLLAASEVDGADCRAYAAILHRKARG